MHMIWFTSDQHFGHRNIIKYSGRPYSDTIEMDLALIQNYNRVVAKDDIVYHLGDLSLDTNNLKTIIPQLKGHKILLPGNHDQCHPRKRGKARRMAHRYVEWGFEKVHLEPFIMFETGILMSHCPSTDAEDPRYEEYRPDPAIYNVLLHGHVHERWKTKYNVRGGLMINVGVDPWNYAPVSLPEIRDLIRNTI